MMRDSSWKRSLSWAALALALLGFVLSLGINLAAWGGINADLSVPWLVLILRADFYVALPVGVVAALYRLLHNQAPSTEAIPAWLNPVLAGSFLLVMVYAVSYQLYGALMFMGEPALTPQLRQIRNESQGWLVGYCLLIWIIVHYGLDRKLRLPGPVAGQSLSR